MIRILSPDNSRLRLVRRLGTRKGRQAEGRFAAEGINLVREAILGGQKVDFVLVSEEYDSPEARELLENADLSVCELPAQLLERVTDAENGVGVLAVVRMPGYDPEMIMDLPEDQNILVLDRIQDPGNIGTMIRTAVAAGYGMIFAVKGTADIYSPKVLRATAGMIFEIPFVYVDSAEELLRILRMSGRRIAVTDPSGGQLYYEADLSRRTALVIGNEGNGISDEIMAAADTRVNLPMKGNIESLNAAVSAAILMYEAVRG